MFLASRMFLLFPICIQQPVYCGEKTFTSIMEENGVVAFHDGKKDREADKWKDSVGQKKV